MNILPLVFAFLAVFVLLSSSFTRELRDLFVEKATFQGSMQASRSALSEVEAERYKKIPEKKAEEKEEEETPSPAKKRDTPFRSYRDKKLCDNEYSKFNLAPLLREKSPKLYKAAAALLKNLYGQVPFFSSQGEGWEYKVLDALLSNPPSDDKDIELIDLVSKQNLAQPLYFKLLRGTKKYQVQTGKGYPPLHHFFTINFQEKKAICFPKASRAVLEAYFGFEVTSKIIDKEKEKWEKAHKQGILTKAELVELVQGKLRGDDPSDDMSFTHPKKMKKKVYSQDEATGISVEASIPE